MPAATNKTPDVMLLIGQLLEAVKAATEGLKSSNVEIQANGKALIAAVKTLELVEATVAELDRVVRTDDDNSVITRLAVLRSEVSDLQTQVAGLEARVHGAAAQITELESARRRLTWGKHTLWEVAKVLGWVITTGVALWAGFGQWASAGGRP